MRQTRQCYNATITRQLLLQFTTDTSIRDSCYHGLQETFLNETVVITIYDAGIANLDRCYVI